MSQSLKRISYKTMRDIKKTIRDFKGYLDEIGKLAENCSPEQQKGLDNILKVQLTMMVSLRKASKLGEISLSFLEE
ncbi:MAG: hypothetical protein IPP74_14700 [Alphaproteobacteria bacterium]|nr:hypothetical protein [Alphaproteobacteria bacterium]